MTLPELKTNIRNRLNKLVPELLKLKFGCEVKYIPEGGNPLPTHKVLGINDDRTVRTETYHSLNLQDIKILGTPPQLQDVLMAIGKIEQGEYMVGLDGHFFRLDKYIGIKYDLTKPVLDQDEPFLRWLYDIIK